MWQKTLLVLRKQHLSKLHLGISVWRWFHIWHPSSLSQLRQSPHGSQLCVCATVIISDPLILWSCTQTNNTQRGQAARWEQAGMVGREKELSRPVVSIEIPVRLWFKRLVWCYREVKVQTTAVNISVLAMCFCHVFSSSSGALSLWRANWDQNQQEANPVTNLG